MTAVTGLEQAMTDSLLALLPGSTRDRAGNVTLTLGQGAPKRLLHCPLDEVGYVVGNITSEGYLLLRRVGAPAYPLFDQELEGHRVTVFGARGAVPGVVAVRSTHLTRGRIAPGSPDPAFTVQSLYASNAGLASVKALLGPFDDIKTAGLPTRYTDTAVETVALDDVDKLAREMVQWMEGR
jgi:putative aminopeptidase FrvX